MVLQSGHLRLEETSRCSKGITFFNEAAIILLVKASKVLHHHCVRSWACTLDRAAGHCFMTQSWQLHLNSMNDTFETATFNFKATGICMT